MFTIIVSRPSSGASWVMLTWASPPPGPVMEKPAKLNWFGPVSFQPSGSRQFRFGRGRVGCTGLSAICVGAGLSLGAV